MSSDVYKFPDFLNALEVMNTKGVAGFYFYLGDGSKDGHNYGLANVAAFFAQSMKETIKVSARTTHVLIFAETSRLSSSGFKYNACDENNWDLHGGGYPVSNAVS